MTVRATWLGQAGFLIEWADASGRPHALAIDPYLSDSLAEKYRGTLFPHVRLRSAPFAPTGLPPLDAVLCTHRHTDHMDPGTLQPLFRHDADALLVAPAAELEEARSRSGLGADRMRLLDAGDVVELGGVTVRAVPAAHETLDRDELGRHRYLGYVIELPGVALYHSGDCVPYPGQPEWLAGVDVALLPVNGRDAYRLEHGVPGNFEFDEAVELCASAGVPTMLAHHWGMFSFNTADPSTFPLEAAGRRGVAVIVPEHAKTLELGGSQP